MQHTNIFANFLFCTLIKKKIKFSSYIGKSRVEQFQSHIWLTVSSIIGKYLRISSYILKSTSSYMTLQLLHSEFPYIWGKFDFLFYQCMLLVFTFLHFSQRMEILDSLENCNKRGISNLLKQCNMRVSFLILILKVV